MREPESIRSRRSHARLVLAALALAALLGTADPALAAPPAKIVFPIVGPVQYQNDFGAPRGSRSHEGNDMMAPRKAPVVAVETGKVLIYNGSSSAGCMIYLYGKSGTTYLYIHLNNDRGNGNDNKGGCKTGVSYAPGLKNGETVRAGELIGFVGNSGDADYTDPHLHFELHPGGDGAVSPYPWLRRSTKLLFAVPKDESGRELQQQTPLTLTGTVVKLVEPAPGEEPVPPDGGQNGGATGAGENGGSPGAGSGTTGSDPGSGGGGSSTAPPPPPPPARRGQQLVAGTLLTIRISSVAIAGGATFTVSRQVTVAVPVDMAVTGTRKGATALVRGVRVTLTTTPVTLGFRAQKAAPGALSLSAISLG